jgi:hypothetical protein
MKLGKWYFRYRQWGMGNKHLQGTEFIDENSPEFVDAMEQIELNPSIAHESLDYFIWIPDIGETFE